MSGASKEPVLGVLPYKGLISTEGVPCLHASWVLRQRKVLNCELVTLWCVGVNQILSFQHVHVQGKAM